MKNFLIIIILIIGFFLVRPFIVKPVVSTAFCITPEKTFAKNLSSQEQLDIAQSHYNSCKLAIVQNEKNFYDTKWTKMSIEELDSSDFTNNPKLLKKIEKTIEILDKFTLNGLLVSDIQNSKLHKKQDAINTLNEMKKIIDPYNFYDEETNTTDMLNDTIKKISTGK